MTLNATVRVKYGQHQGEIGIVIAISDKIDFLIDFDDGRNHWISGFRLEQL